MEFLRRKTHTVLKQAKTLGTPSLGPSTPGIKSMRGPIQLKGLTTVHLSPFSAPSPAKKPDPEIRAGNRKREIKERK